MENDEDNPVLPVVDVEALNREMSDQRRESITRSGVELGAMVRKECNSYNQRQVEQRKKKLQETYVAAIP